MKKKIYVNGWEIFPQEHAPVAVVELDWGKKSGRTLHDVINEAKILNVCDFSEIKSQLEFSATSAPAKEWNFWAHGFVTFKYSDKEAVAVVIDHELHNDGYQLFKYHVAVFQRKAKLERLNWRK